MKTFTKILDEFNWEDESESIFSKTSEDVELALSKSSRRTPDDFKALISPAGANYLEELAAESQRITQKRFGKTIQLYAPLYLSNECMNICTYCAFSLDNKIHRVTLNEAQVIEEILILKKMGFDHVLIVTGEANNMVGMEYFRKIMPLIRKNFTHISFEVQPMDQEDYEELISLGVNTVLVYQETYHREQYQNHHPRGKKSNFNYRLETPERLGKAGVYKIGLGVLLGLGYQEKGQGGNEQYGANWRTDSFFCALHLRYLEKKFWQTKYSVSFPRLRPIEIASSIENNGGQSLLKSFNQGISDRELVQLICAYRLFDEEVELSVSTRESENFRNNIINLGVTSMSAGSKTNPGGYSSEKNSLEQFEISDDRAPVVISEMLRKKGYEPVWKDWDRAMGIK